MSLKHGLLGILSYSDMTGYDLGKAFQESLSFFWQAQTSQVYRELNKMEEAGFLTSHIEIQTDKPNKRIYSITKNGRNELSEWLKSPVPDEMIPTRSEVLMRLFFSSTNSREYNIEMLRAIVSSYRIQAAQLEGIDRTIEEYKAIAHSEEDTLYWDLTAEFGRDYSRMCLEWAEKCIRRLEDYKK